MALKQATWLGQTGYLDETGVDPSLYRTPYASSDERMGTVGRNLAGVVTNPNATYKDWLMSGFQVDPSQNFGNWLYGTGGGQGHNVYDTILGRLDKTGWDDATKKTAVQRAIENHYNTHGSGFTEWSSEEGLAGLLGLPDYNQQKMDREAQAYSQRHAEYSAEADAESMQTFTTALLSALGAAGAYAAAGAGAAGAAGSSMAGVNAGAAGAMGGQVTGGLTLADTLGGAWGGFGGFGDGFVGGGSGLDGGAMDLGDWQDWGSFTNTGDGMGAGADAFGNFDMGYGLTGNELPAGLPAGGGGIMDTLKQIQQATGLTNRDLLNLGGKGLAALLQAYSSNQQSGALSGLAGQYSAQGAPSRARFEASMTPGFDPMSIPGYKGALDTASESLLARLSASGGNPWGNPQGLIQANKQIVNGTALPAINEYQRLNLGAGGMANLNAAIPGLQTGAIGQDANVLAALGSGLGSMTAPDNSLANIIRQLQQAGLTLNNGMGL